MPRGGPSCAVVRHRGAVSRCRRGRGAARMSWWATVSRAHRIANGQALGPCQVRYQYANSRRGLILGPNMSAWVAEARMLEGWLHCGVRSGCVCLVAVWEVYLIRRPGHQGAAGWGIRCFAAAEGAGQNDERGVLLRKRPLQTAPAEYSVPPHCTKLVKLGETGHALPRRPPHPSHTRDAGHPPPIALARRGGDRRPVGRRGCAICASARALGGRRCATAWSRRALHVPGACRISTSQTRSKILLRVNADEL